MDAGMFTLGLVGLVVVGVVGVVAAVFGRGFKGEVSRDRLGLRVEGSRHE